MSEPVAQLKEGIGMAFPYTRELPEKHSANLGLLFRAARITKTVSSLGTVSNHTLA